MAHSNLAKAANSLLTAAEVNKLLSEDGSGNFSISGGKTITIPGEDILLTGTNALQLPVGTTAQQPAGANGKIRMNSDYGRPEYYSSIMSLWIPFNYGGGEPNIGDPYGGGFFAGYISTSADGVATHRLIVSPMASGQTTAAWDDNAYGTTGVVSVIDGPQNTIDLMALDATHFLAAKFCSDLTIGAYSDWYLPAKNELETAYRNLKNVSEANYQPGTHGANANAVPPLEPISTAHTAANPAQTSVAAFRVGGTEAFADYFFWSSTEAAATTAWAQHFTSGYPGAQSPHAKTYATTYVRAFRRLAI